MRRIALTLIVGFATLAAVLVLVPQDAHARGGYRGFGGGYGGGYGYRTRGYRPYSTYYRPYRYRSYYRYPAVYRPYGYVAPSYGPSPYGYRGMAIPPVQINPGFYYRF